MFNLRSCTKLIINLKNFDGISQVSQRHIKRWIAPTQKELTKRKKNQINPIDSPRNKYLEWNRQAELYSFNVRLSEKFNPDLLQQAFVHRSYVIKEEEEQKKVGIEDPKLDIVDNQELIKEGRQILPLIIGNYLSKALPFSPLECIHALSNYLLTTESLVKTACGIGTKDLILSMEYPLEDETIVNTFYALISALNRSVDLEHTAVFVRDILISRLVEKDLSEIWCPENPIDILNQILTNEQRELVEPRIIGQTGISTLIPVYQIGLYSNKEFLSSGFGESIEEAKKVAGLNALTKMFGLSDCSNPIRCNLNIDDTGSPNLPIAEWSRSRI